MRICITGGTGSLGQALTRRLLADGHTVCVLSRDEVKQAMMALEYVPEDRLRFFLGDVRDQARLEDAFYGCDAVVHAAALKRVDSVAYNPSEVRKTNIQGSANVIAAATTAHVEKVLMISSDKACYPTNIYGVTKAAMEHEAVASNVYTYPRGTRVSVLRYGNVLGSRGSVIHLWRQMVRDGQPIKLTDERMTRFWVTLTRACDLVVRSLVHMYGGEIFVPVMPGALLKDLAEAIAPGHQIEIMGLRPGGEKLHETVLTHDESYRTRSEGDLMAVAPQLSPWSQYRPWLTWGKPIIPSDITSEQADRLTVDHLRELAECVG